MLNYKTKNKFVYELVFNQLINVLLCSIKKYDILIFSNYSNLNIYIIPLLKFKNANFYRIKFCHNK
jgi:hypothetical protein